MHTTASDGGENGVGEDSPNFFVRGLVFFRETKWLFYSTVLVCALAPTVLMSPMGKLTAESHIIFAGFHVLTVLYFFDFLQLILHKPNYGPRQRITAFHVFVVAWLLPFVMTFMPSIQNIVEDNYFQHILHVEMAHIETVRMQTIVRSALFSSLVVLVPLEFFQLLFIAQRDAYYRHALITAGCLDVGTLFFLLQLADEGRIAKIYSSHERSILMAYLLAIWILSLLASFRAIYISQYSETSPSEKPSSADPHD